MKLIVMRGLPRSGKSTIAAKLKATLEKRGFSCGAVALDEIRQNLFGQPYWGPGEFRVWQAAEQAVSDAGDFYDVCIVDECNLRYDEQCRWKQFQAPDVEVRWLHVTTPFNVCLSRAAGSPLENVIHFKQAERWDGGLQDEVCTDGEFPISDTELWRVMSALGLVDEKATA